MRSPVEERTLKVAAFVFISILPAAMSIGPSTCSSGYFSCMNGNCIAETKVNNSVNDCNDNSDEGIGAISLENCQPAQGKRKFKCNNGHCVSLDWYLDGAPDCSDGSDEFKTIGSRCSNLPIDQGIDLIIPTPCNDTVPHSVCVQPPTVGMTGVCRCASGHYTNSLGTNCIIRRLGDQCEIHADCFDAVPNAACLNYSCDCAAGHYNQSDRCIRRKIDDICARPEDCSMAVNHSVCLQNKCICEDGYLATTDKTQCKIPEINSLECAKDVDCIVYFNNTICSSDICLCHPAFYPDSFKRFCIAYQLDSPCNNTSSCLGAINNTQCLGQKCTCATGYFEDNPKLCLPRIIGKDGCWSGADCSAVSNSKCSRPTSGTSGTCVCQLGYMQNSDGTTCSLRKIGDPCQALEDCSVAVTESECIGTRCRCESGYKETNGGRTCSPLQVGDECQNDGDCQRFMNSSKCSDTRKCVCVSGFEPTDDRSGCKRSPVHRIVCSDDVFCRLLVNHSVCGAEGKCSCAADYYPSPDGTRCLLLEVNSLQCNSDAWCYTAMNSTLCQDGLCVCLPGFYPDTTRRQCVNASIGKTACQDDSTCQLAIYKSQCLDGVCQCSTGYRMLGGRSCVATQLGQSCRVDSNCAFYIEHSTCINQTCGCDLGYHSRDNITCIPDYQLITCESKDCSTTGWCTGIIGFILGILLILAILGCILLTMKLKKQTLKKRQRVAPMEAICGMNQKWQLDWNNRPPAHIPVMYKSPCLKAPDELYGDLLNIDFKKMRFDSYEVKLSQKGTQIFQAP